MKLVGSDIRAKSKTCAAPPPHVSDHLPRAFASHPSELRAVGLRVDFDPIAWNGCPTYLVYNNNIKAYARA
jgi:hypothetical protein